MKIRAGFVSNSSTTSFCIFGFIKESGEIEEAIKEKTGNEDMYDFTKNGDMDYHMCHWDDNVYFGFPFEGIPDDAVVGEWKAAREKELKEIFGEDIVCELHTEGWQDG